MSASGPRDGGSQRRKGGEVGRAQPSTYTRGNKTAIFVREETPGNYTASACLDRGMPDKSFFDAARIPPIEPPSLPEGESVGGQRRRNLFPPFRMTDTTVFPKTPRAPPPRNFVLLHYPLFTGCESLLQALEMENSIQRVWSNIFLSIIVVKRKLSPLRIDRIIRRFFFNSSNTFHFRIQKRLGGTKRREGRELTNSRIRVLKWKQRGDRDDGKRGLRGRTRSPK